MRERDIETFEVRRATVPSFVAVAIGLGVVYALLALGILDLGDRPVGRFVTALWPIAVVAMGLFVINAVKVLVDEQPAIQLRQGSAEFRHVLTRWRPVIIDRSDVRDARQLARPVDGLLIAADRIGRIVVNRWSIDDYDGFVDAFEAWPGRSVEGSGRRPS